MKKKLFILLATPLVLGVFITTVVPKKAAALSGNDFSAGNIIDDAVFYDSAALNATDIQTFLNAKLPSCDTNGTIQKSYYYNAATGKISGSSFSGASYVTTSRAIYGARYNKYYNVTYAGAPYVCLKDYKQNTPEKLAESGICGHLPAQTGRSAALIISDVSSACGINPKVLIVLLQKEQGLVTDDWPWDNQFDKATGFACPDTSGCNTAYYGFFNQVYSAARQFKRYQADPTNWNYVAGQNNKIYYNPNSACSYSWVYIQNQATAGLYDYTPYQPNAAALKNLYGSGDGCSAYGNRNFWRYFNDWFGTTRATPFFRIGSTDAVYILGSNNNYYHVPTADILFQYGYKTRFNVINSFSSTYLQGKTNSGTLPRIARFEGTAIYLVDNSVTHHFTSGTQFNSFGYIAGQEATLPSWIFSKLGTSTDMQSVMRLISAPEIYYVNNGKKSHIINPTAYTTLGSPVYSSQASVTLSTSYATTLPLGPPIMPANTITKATDSGAYGVWDGSTLQSIDPTTIQISGIGPDYATVTAVLNQLAASSNPTIGKLTKDSSGALYILDYKTKFTVANGQLADLNLQSTDFVPAPDAYLGRYNTTSMSTLVRINNGDPVYSIQNGKLYHVYSGADFAGLGYTPSSVLSVSTSTSSLFVNSGIQLFAQGKLVRIGSQSQVYLINGSFAKQWIPTAAVFNNFGFSLNSVVSVPGSALTGYTSGSNLTQVNKDSLGVVWLIDSGVRHKIPSSLLGSTYYNIDQVNTTVLASQILNSISTSNDLTDYIRASGQSRVYAVKNGQKCWFTSGASFISHGGSWDQVRNLSASYVASLPTGPSIN